MRSSRVCSLGWILAATLEILGCEAGLIAGGDGSVADARRSDARADATVAPDGAMSIEICGNGIDDNADGRIDEDCACAAGGRRECYPGPAGTAGIGACRAGLQSCEASGIWGRCENFASPGGERCDGVDNDCDGMIDEGCDCRIGFTRGCYAGAMGTAGVGACHEGVQTCQEDPDGRTTWSDCAGAVVPLPESCNSLDDNCDGRIDEGCTCTLGQTRTCYTGPAGTGGVGACRNGMQSCVSVMQVLQWGSCTGSVVPTAERCDAIDNDCNGRADEGCLCGPGQTPTFRMRDLTRLALRSDIQPGDGQPIMPMTCEARRCPDGQVAVQTSLTAFACVPPPPACATGTQPNYVSGSWRCDPPCDTLITYGALYGNLVVCAGRPNVMCGTGQAPTFVYETRTWQCRPMCDNGQYDIRMFGTLTVCIPC